jgi:Glyoxalase-like domain
MTVELVAVAFDARSPRELARFWAHALEWEIGAGGVELVPADATSFRIVFHQIAHPKVGQNRIHFDLTTASPDDQARTVADFLARGAGHVDIGQDPDDTHVVLADPEGNELCVIEPQNRFLAGCPRLGAVNCDGTHALGRFWSAALGWPLVWDHGEETAIQAPAGNGPKITWSGPPLMPKPPVERMHFHVGAPPGATPDDAIEHLLALGATRVTAADAGCGGAVGLADVDGNAFCLVTR